MQIKKQTISSHCSKRKFNKWFIEAVRALSRANLKLFKLLADAKKSKELSGS